MDLVSQTPRPRGRGRPLFADIFIMCERFARIPPKHASQKRRFSSAENREAIRENRAIRANLRIDSRGIGPPKVRRITCHSPRKGGKDGATLVCVFGQCYRTRSSSACHDYTFDLLGLLTLLWVSKESTFEESWCL